MLDLDVQVWQHGHILSTSPDEQGNAAPGDDDDRHDGRGDHDFEGFITRLVEAKKVLAEEIHGDQHGQGDGAPADDDLADLTRVLLVESQRFVDIR